MKIFRQLVLCSVLVLSSCSSVKIPTIYDGGKYGVKPIEMYSTKKVCVYSNLCLPEFETWAEKKALKKYSSIEEMLEKSNTTSFVVMKNGKLIYENYSNGIHQGDKTQIFSVSKVFVTTLLGIAIQEGKIQSMDQPVSDFIPEFKEGDLNRITLYHLTQMQSGLNYNEYKRVVQTLKFYNQKNVWDAFSKIKIKDEPGTVFKYKSIDTQILGRCIEIAAGKPFLEYINEKLLSQLGFQDPIAWSVDSKTSGNPKYYGGVNISGRDLAKFGNLFVNNGILQGKQVLNPYTTTVCRDITCRNVKGNYCNGWWYDTWDPENNVFFAAGYKGQIMMINKDNGVVIVRLGENKGGLQWYKMLKELSIQIGKEDSDNSNNAQENLTHK